MVRSLLVLNYSSPSCHGGFGDLDVAAWFKNGEEHCLQIVLNIAAYFFSAEVHIIHLTASSAVELFLAGVDVFIYFRKLFIHVYKVLVFLLSHFVILLFQVEKLALILGKFSQLWRLLRPGVLVIVVVSQLQRSLLALFKKLHVGVKELSTLGCLVVFVEDVHLLDFPLQRLGESPRDFVYLQLPVVHSQVISGALFTQHNLLTVANGNARGPMFVANN